MRLVFLGTGAIGVPSLRLLAEEHEVAAVFTQPDRPAGRDLKLKPSPVKVAAEALGLPVFQPERIRRPEALSQLESLRPQAIVVVAYGQILPRPILDLPELGCLNVHASLLPRHRGASPIHAAILAGDHESGVTIMRMDEGLDTGDILRMDVVPIGRHETAGSLHDRLAEVAAEPLRQTLRELGAGIAVRQPQDDALATHAAKLARENGRINWQKSAEEIGRTIRGLTPWPGAFTTLPSEGQHVLWKIHSVAVQRRGGGGTPGQVIRANNRGVLVAAGEGAILLREVQAAGGRRLRAGDFLRGRAVPVGTVLGG